MDEIFKVMRNTKKQGENRKEYKEKGRGGSIFGCVDRSVRAVCCKPWRKLALAGSRNFRRLRRLASALGGVSPSSASCARASCSLPYQLSTSHPAAAAASLPSFTMRASLRPSDPAASPVIERVNAELFTLTYGAIVRQLLTDYEEIEEVNKQLDTMGYNIGARLVDDFLAKANITKCTDFRETADVIAKVGFKMFLNVTATVANWSADNMECSLILEDNPLVDFVELPEACQGLSYCNILCGVLRGALEMVSMRTEVKFVKDMLRGDDVFEMRLKLLEQMPEEYPYKNDE